MRPLPYFFRSICISIGVLIVFLLILCLIFGDDLKSLHIRSHIVKVDIIYQQNCKVTLDNDLEKDFGKCDWSSVFEGKFANNDEGHLILERYSPKLIGRINRISDNSLEYEVVHLPMGLAELVCPLRNNQKRLTSQPVDTSNQSDRILRAFGYSVPCSIHKLGEESYSIKIPL